MTEPTAAAVSWASSPSVRRVMQGNSRKRDTSPELTLRRAAHRMGLRYRVATRPLPQTGRADLVFAGARVAVYVDGCFWHGCPEHFAPPRTNAGYWEPKIARNRARDARGDELLRSAGWACVRVWEHEDAEAAAGKLAAVIAARSRLVKGRPA